MRRLVPGGRAVIVGVDKSEVTASRLMSFVMFERELLGSYGNGPAEAREVIAMLAGGRLMLARMIGDVISLEDVLGGVRRVDLGQTGDSRILVDITA